MTPKRRDHVIRFSRGARLQHLAVIVLFGVLIVTGLPQKWPYADVSRAVIELMGGIFVTRFIHRMTGIAFTLLVVGHLAWTLFVVLTRRAQPTLLFARKDFTDALHNLRYYLGREKKPPLFGRYDYRQKFEYWGLIFGSVIMAVTGLVLYFPIAFSRILPAELIPASKAMHSNEAMLALLIVLVWHMYSAHLNPEVFPADMSIFTGKISRERLEREHPLEADEASPEA
jgi:formate dehydrogenase gamma subunit